MSRNGESSRSANNGESPQGEILSNPSANDIKHSPELVGVANRQEQPRFRRANRRSIGTRKRARNVSAATATPPGNFVDSVKDAELSHIDLSSNFQGLRLGESVPPTGGMRRLALFRLRDKPEHNGNFTNSATSQETKALNNLPAAGSSDPKHTTEHNSVPEVGDLGYEADSERESAEEGTNTAGGGRRTFKKKRRDENSHRKSGSLNWGQGQLKAQVKLDVYKSKAKSASDYGQ